MRIEVQGETRLRFDTGEPVRAASAIARLGDGWLVAQDDATHAAWCRPAGVTALRLVPAVGGHEVFSAAAGTKHLKPDFEAACDVVVDGRPGVLLLGSGSTPARTRACLVALDSSRPRPYVTDLSPVYAKVVEALGVPDGQVNLEGACRRGRWLRWFQRGNASAGVPSASVDVDYAALLAVVTGAGGAGAVGVGGRRHYDLGEIDGVGLAVTDAVALPDGRILLSATAEDTPNAVDDGPVTGSALVLVDDDRVLSVAGLPEPGGAPYKVEGLAFRDVMADGALLLAVVDSDDPDVPSAQMTLRVRW